MASFGQRGYWPSSTTTTSATNAVVGGGQLRGNTGTDVFGRAALGDISNSMTNRGTGLAAAKAPGLTDTTYGATTTTTTTSVTALNAVIPSNSGTQQNTDTFMETAAPMTGVTHDFPGAQFDIDMHDVNDELACAEFVEEVYLYLRESERKRRVNPQYIHHQQDINSSMRAILIDWLVEVTEEYKLDVETLHLAVGYVDRFLSQTHVFRSKLQLVGMTALLIASKFEEIYAPTVDDFVYISDKTYTRDEVLRMEQLILGTLQFDLVSPTANAFLRRFCKAAGFDQRSKSLAYYYAELTLQNIRFVGYAPSMVAAAAVCLVRSTGGAADLWTDTLVYHTQYEASDLSDCVTELYNAVINAPYVDLKAVYEKYSHSKHLHVSTLPVPQVNPATLLA